MKAPNKAIRDAYDTLLYQTVQQGGENVFFYDAVPQKAQNLLHYVVYDDVLTNDPELPCKGGFSNRVTMVMRVITKNNNESGGYDKADNISTLITEQIVGRPSPLNIAGGLNAAGFHVVTTPSVNVQRIPKGLSEEYAYYGNLITISHEIQQL